MGELPMSAVKDSLRELSFLFSEAKVSEKSLKKDTKSFFHVFSKLKDKRHPSYVRYRLADLIGICFVMALMGEFTSFYHVEQYVILKPERFIKLGLVEKGCYPSNDTYRRAFAYIDNTEFRETLIGGLRQFFAKVDACTSAKGKRMISGDGQEIRGTGRKKSDGTSERNVNVLNLYDVSSSVTMISVPVEKKTNEIPVFQHLLKIYDIRDTIVTADALHLQKDTCRIITERKGYYCIAAKENQPELKARIGKIFSSERKRESFREFDRDYSIIRLREEEIAPEWAGAKSVVMTVSHKRVGRKEGPSPVMYFLTSLTDREEIAETVQRRWEIENGLHRFKDTNLSQDRIRVRDRNALKNMATLNNVVYSLYRIAAGIVGKTPNQTKILYGDRPEELIGRIYPLTLGNRFTMLVKKKMRGTKESRKS